ncbi:MAG TPA: phosphotransferase family protein, partial [Candidatus Angelobacter sp.]|nr:phosphotransferase family protein [Candidatus Angelobacter sp.]
DVAAVVDWEMTALGDPLTDVGLLVVYQTLSLEGGFVMPTVTAASGFATAEEMVARYAAGSSRDMTALDWYTSFAYYKLAVIAEGIHYRYLQGKTVGPGFDDVGRWVPTLLESAARHLDRYAP